MAKYAEYLFHCPKCRTDFFAPQKKEWVGLTDKEIAHIEDMTLDKGDAIRLTAVALMEKNL